MKKFIFILLCFFVLAQPLSAATKPTVSISDAIYADLALRNYLDNVSIYYDGGRQDVAKLNETKHWLPASTVKMFAAMYAYKLISEGKLNLNDYITIDAKNDVPTELVTNDLPTLLEGQSVTVDRLIRQMIIQSDNTAFNQLVDVLGRNNITAYIESLGLIHSHVGSKLNLDTSQEQYEFDTPGYGINTTTAEDYAKAFTLIKNDKIPGAKDLFQVLKDQRINNMIPYYLPKTVVCAHKTGDLDPLYHDGGICQDKKRSYVLTIFTNAGDPNVVAHLSELVYTKNYNLVGATLSHQTVSENTSEHSIDPLVMKPVDTTVLGASTQNLPVPDITAADLGVTLNDLSLVIKDKDLPHVLIPADSPFHSLSDEWEVLKLAIAPNEDARLAANLDIAKLRLAEAKDLIQRGKSSQAKEILQTVQTGMTKIVQDPILAHDSTAQNTIQAISETKFSILGSQLQQAKGDEKLTIIHDIATQAKDTIQHVQPNIPDATNAVNPSQKPLVGQIVATTNNSITVKTAGGQEVTVPTNAGIKIKEKTEQQSFVTPTLSPSETPTTPVPSTTPAEPQSLNNLPVGTTVALIGSNTNNTFAPSLVLTNLPRELAAPEPVTVAKVDTKNKTMVVIENGVYTQVNVNENTSIKGSDTNIPLNAIKAGDVVVVHGEPLQNKTLPSPTTTPQGTAVPTGEPVQTKTLPSPTTTPQGTIVPTKGIITASPKETVIPSGTTIIPSQKAGTTSSGNTGQKLAPTSTSVANSSTQPKTVTQSPAVKTSTPSQPVVIQGKSIQVIEKKTDVKNTPSNPAPAVQKPAENKPQQSTQNQPQPPAAQPPAAKQPAKTEETKQK